MSPRSPDPTDGGAGPDRSDDPPARPDRPPGRTDRPGAGSSARRADGDGPDHRRRLAVFAAGLASFLLFRLATWAPHLVEEVYGRRIGPAAAWLLSRLTGVVPVPIAELLLAGYVAWLAASAIRALGQVRAGRRGALGAVAGGGSRLARDAGVLVASFYLLWGFHYARPDLEGRTGLPAAGDADRAELVRLAERSVAATNQAYRALHGTDDAGAPTAVPPDHGDRLREALLEGWRRLADRRGFPDHHGWRYGPAKEFVPDGLLVRFGLGGFYFPWTGEAVVDGGTPASDLVQSVAHEAAHQRGIAPEDEASFVGFLAASRAPHPLARYSALLFAQRHLVSAAASGAPELRAELTAARLPGVTRDLRDLYAYLRRRIDSAARATRRMNDAYLRSNRVEGGIASYGMVVRLLVAEARGRGEERLFQPHRSQPPQPGDSSPK